MRRKFKPIDPNELLDADDINRTTIKGEMRKLYTAIHQKLSQGGWAARDIVKWLEERGLVMSVELFRVYLRDLDREQGYDRSTNTFKNANAHSDVSTPISSSIKHVTSKLVKTASEVPPAGKASKRKTILSTDKGIFGELDPPPANGNVELKQD
jgi:hypothetical protein